MAQWGAYGDVAVHATHLVRAGEQESVLAAWDVAAAEAFPGRVASQRKGCPKCAYLGLCEEKLVVGVPGGAYTTSRDNKDYAVAAVHLLRADPVLATTGPTELWRRVMNGKEKRSNSQMDVVLALWTSGLIAPGAVGGRRM